MRAETSLPDMIRSPPKGTKIASNGTTAISAKMMLKFSISSHKYQKASNENNGEKEHPQIGIF